MADRLTFYSCGGSVLWLGRHELSEADVEALLGTFWDERLSAREACDGAAYMHATKLSDELLNAVEASKRWRKASGPVANLSTNGRG